MEPLWIKFVKEVLFFLYYVDLSGGYIKIDKILGLPKFQYLKNQVSHCLAILEFL
jgi:hypothetical protein